MGWGWDSSAAGRLRTSLPSSARAPGGEPTQGSDRRQNNSGNGPPRARPVAQSVRGGVPAGSTTLWRSKLARWGGVTPTHHAVGRDDGLAGILSRSLVWFEKDPFGVLRQRGADPAAEGDPHRYWNPTRSRCSWFEFDEFTNSMCRHEPAVCTALARGRREMPESLDQGPENWIPGLFGLIPGNGSGGVLLRALMPFTPVINGENHNSSWRFLRVSPTTTPLQPTQVGQDVLIGHPFGYPITDGTISIPGATATECRPSLKSSSC